MSHVNIDTDGDVTVLRLARPPVNAMSPELTDELEAAVREHGGSASAIVLTGEGKCFSAGVDTKLATGFDAAQLEQMVRGINAVYRTMYACPVPLVAAVNGHALAGGFVMALAADVVVATDAECALGLAEVRAGVPFPLVPLALVHSELDPSAQRVLAQTGRNLTPQEALELRVIDEVAPADGLMERAVALAGELAALPAYGPVKAQLRARVLSEIDAGIEADADPMLTNWL